MLFLDKQNVIDFYLDSGQISGKLESAKKELLRQVFYLALDVPDQDFLLHVSSLIAECTLEMEEHGDFETLLAKVGAQAIAPNIDI
ncbi:hypothetical protein M8998_03730 [Sphingobacterium sp. lm-10]|uniref:hypothetical protein n=1 Tax=Sphingobacterium sp. lm-10 TaxID=2944904 RepID=UPI002020443E|nr:hypothetical protein [Sphingobacterium sp. lm-10]MCL7987048.1 hypothetical protein [Sphingobacterium sp. lm-10]